MLISGIYQAWQAPFSEINASLAYAITWVLAWFLVLARVSYRGFDAWVELLSEQPAES